MISKSCIAELMVPCCVFIPHNLFFSFPQSFFLSTAALLRENADLKSELLRNKEELAITREELRKLRNNSVPQSSQDSLQPMRDMMKKSGGSPVRGRSPSPTRSGKGTVSVGIVRENSPMQPPAVTKHQQQQQQPTATPFKFREKIIEEVVATESAYVENMHLLHSLYHNALLAMLQGTEHEQPFTQEQFDAIFGNSCSIQSLNEDFLAALVEKREQWDVEHSTIGDVFLRFKDLFKLYGPYCSGYANACIVVDKLTRTSSQFRDVLRLIGKLSEVKSLDLVSFLAMPFQRIARYHLLLNELHKHTPTTHPDYPLIEKALFGYREIAAVCNSKVDRSERGARIIQISSQLLGYPGVLLDPARVFVKEGTFHKITSTIITSDWHFLFSDLLVYTRKISDTSYSFKGAIPLAECWIRDLPDTAHLRNLFQLVAPAKTYVYQFDSAEDKTSWRDAIQTCINKLVEIDPTVILRRGEVKARNVSVLGSVLSYKPEMVDPTTMDELPVDLEEMDEFVLISSRGQSTVSVDDHHHNDVVPVEAPAEPSNLHEQGFDDFNFWGLPPHVIDDADGGGGGE